MASPTIQQACANDLENILQLQKQAFTTVAQLLNNHNIQPLHQNLQEITAEYNKGIILKYLSPQNELIGSIRAYEDDNATCHVGKLIVQPSHQNQGIGRKLLETIETHFPNCTKFSLFTVEDTPQHRTALPQSRLPHRRTTQHRPQQHAHHGESKHPPHFIAITPPMSTQPFNALI